jgi:hypothetical protein
MLSRAKQAIAIAFAISALFGLSPSRAQQSIEEGAGDPSTPLGRSMNQNQQEQQQNQQSMQRDQQNWNQYMHGQQQNQSNQGGYYQAPAENGGVYGAIFVDPANPSISRFSYSFSSPVTARAGAKGACYGAAGYKPCILALEYHNACAALAHGSNRVWAARAAGSLEAARAEATVACQRAGGRSCTVGPGVCSPNYNE